MRGRMRCGVGLGYRHVLPPRQRAQAGLHGAALARCAASGRAPGRYRPPVALEQGKHRRPYGNDHAPGADGRRAHRFRFVHGAEEAWRHEDRERLLCHEAGGSRCRERPDRQGNVQSAVRQGGVRPELAMVRQHQEVRRRPFGAAGKRSEELARCADRGDG